MRDALEAYADNRIAASLDAPTPLRKRLRVEAKKLLYQRCLRSIMINPGEASIYEKSTGYSRCSRYASTNRGGERGYRLVSIMRFM